MNHKNLQVNHQNLKSKKYLYLKSFFYESEEVMEDVVNEDMFKKKLMCISTAKLSISYGRPL